MGGSSITGLDPATYQVTVTDVGDPATTVVLSYTVTEDPALTLSLSKTDDGCPGDADGSVTATPGGGSGMGFTYVWFRNDHSDGGYYTSLLCCGFGRIQGDRFRCGLPTCTITDSIVVLNSNTESMAPHRIRYTNDNTCQGTTKTLIVTGWKPG